VVLKGKVAGVEHMKFEVLEIALERAAAFLREDRIICAPQQKHRRLIIAEILVPARILFDIGPIIVEKIELDPMISRTAQEEQVGVPVVRADLLCASRALAVDPLHAIGCEETGQGRLGFRSAILPERGPERVPDSRKALFIGVAVLVDDPLNPIGMAHRDAESHRGAIVLNEQREPPQFKRFQEFLDNLR
jgi:hypothetical protein